MSMVIYRFHPSKVETLYRYKRPVNLTQLLSFLGLEQYYRKFIVDFSRIAQPLFDLTGKDGCERDGRLKWNDECELAFNTLRTALTSDNFLILPDLKKPFRVDTDACNTGIWAVLSQLVNGDYRPVAYFSKSLNKAQRNYSTSEKELLAIVLAVEHFHQYLYGRLFGVIVDHQPLAWLLSSKKPNPRVG
jgi:hypothetical protein